MNITAKTIHVMGDIHNEIELVNQYIDEHHPDVLILLGDVALFWGREVITPDPTSIAGFQRHVMVDSYGFSHIDPKDTKVFWIMGNHEHWDYVERTYGRNGLKPVEMMPNLYYCPIGAALTINGRNCLFIGGALSIDAEFRTEGVSWFPQEIVTDHDLQFIKDGWQDKKVDLIFSHTCPLGFQVSAPHDLYGLKFNDPSRIVLREIADVFQPKYWFFGHWHRSIGGAALNIIWQCVNTTTPGWEEGGQSAYDISSLFELDDSYYEK